MPDLKISELGAAGALDGSELIEAVQGGTNVKTTPQDIATIAMSREFNRTFSEDLVFDKHEIFHVPVTLSADLNLTEGSGGLLNEASGMRFRFTTDRT